MAVPGREIQADLQALRAKGIHKLADQVAAPTAPWRKLDRVVGGRTRPQAESIVVFCGEDADLQAGLSGHARPLTAVELGRMKYLGDSVPSPHSRPVNVLMDRWTNKFVSVRCQPS